jgi:glycogen debranching enzyme
VKPEIPVGPLELVIHEGDSVLVTARDGEIKEPGKDGLFFRDTRLISAWQISANGAPWQLLNASNLEHYAARVIFTNCVIKTREDEIKPKTLGMSLGRSLVGGMHDDIDIRNYSRRRACFNLEILIRSDFADIFEVKSGTKVVRSGIATDWSPARSRWHSGYRHADFYRAVTVSVHNSGSPVQFANGRLTFEVDLASQRSWHACLLYELHDGRQRLAAARQCIAQVRDSSVGRRTRSWHRRVLAVHIGEASTDDLFQQAIADLAALRLPQRAERRHFLPAAGIPWFLALFGRDSLIVSLQTLLLDASFARTTLEVLGRWQARVRDDYRDAEPGKILHELRRGELAHFRQIPHTPYYGTADATILYLILLHAAWRVSGDRELLRRHLATAERCLKWIARYGDRDGDGFQEYATRSSAGYENQGWKDAADAVLNADGSPVQGPKALCELQGYVYDAWLRMAEVFDELGRRAQARALRRSARALFERFNRCFWDESLGFYAFALDGQKRKVVSVASNAGQCLWSGIVPPARAERVVRRLLRRDMCSGWGIRTLSSGHPAYNPHSYQRGSVWPHDNGIIALGMRRYGFDAAAAQVIHQVVSAASYFKGKEVPELYGGLARAAQTFPVQYVGANVPQAWAAGSNFMMLQALLGIEPDAPRDLLYVDPFLPAWLPEVTLKNLRFGRHCMTLRFWREGTQSCWEVLQGDRNRVRQRPLAQGAPAGGILS